MRILANMNEAVGVGPTPQIIQVDSTPQVGAATKINGKFIIDVPPGAALLNPSTRVEVDIDASSTILPIPSHFIDFPYTIGATPTDVHSQMFAGLLAQFPNFSHIYFNPLVVETDSTEIDPGATFLGAESRIQFGRSGPPPQGLSPNMTAVLGQNPGSGKSGILITALVDLAPFIPAGASSFCVYWKVHSFQSSEDINSFAGFHGDSNNPAIKSQIEVGEGYSSNFEVHVSNDDGATYTQVSYLTPITLLAAGTNLRLAFKNTSPAKVYLSNFAIMFA